MAIRGIELHKVKKHLSLIELATYTYIAVFQSRASNMTTYSPSKEYDMGYFNKISKLKEYHHILEGVTVCNEDCMVLLERYRECKSMLLYLDPPYIPNTHASKIPTYGEDSWSMEQHQVLVEQLLKTKARIILSGYLDTEFDTYKPLEDAGWQRILLKNVHVSSSVGNTRQNEYIWVNFEINSYTLQKITSNSLE